MENTESREMAKLHVSVIPEFVPSKEFDRMAVLFGYVKERTCTAKYIRSIEAFDNDLEGTKSLHLYDFSCCGESWVHEEGRCPSCGAKVVG